MGAFNLREGRLTLGRKGLPQIKPAQGLVLGLFRPFRVSELRAERMISLILKPLVLKQDAGRGANEDAVATLHILG